jgi:hypothetical protein
MSIINKQLPKDPQYMVDARGLYDEKCISVAKKNLKKEVSNGRWGNRQVQSYEVVKSIINQLKEDPQTGLEDFKRNYPDGGSKSIDKVLGVLLWDIIDQDSDDWEWSNDDNHSYCKIYRVKLN